MIWIVCFTVAAAVLLLMTLQAIRSGRRRHRSGEGLGFTVTLLVGVVIAAFVLFIPVYMQALKANSGGLFDAVLVALHSVMRLFTVDGDFMLVSEQLAGVSGWLQPVYGALLLLLFVLVPLLSSVVVLSFFKIVGVYRAILGSLGKPWYVFSELNDKSVAMAVSLREEAPRALLLFADVYVKHNEENRERLDAVEQLGGVCISHDVIRFLPPLLSTKTVARFVPAITWFFIGEDEAENVNQSLLLISSPHGWKKLYAYVFSTQPEAELLIANALRMADTGENTQVRLINDAKRLAIDQVDRRGYELFFEGATPSPDGNRTISAVIVGLGRHGEEMIKAMSWACQMDGYDLVINAFDRRPQAASRLASQCPELMEPRDGKDGPLYLITVHTSIDVRAAEFDQIIRSLPPVTYVLVALGDDSLNVTTSMKMRSLCESMGWYPHVQAVVYDSFKAGFVQKMTTYRGEAYNIDCIGGLFEFYSADLIHSGDSEQAAHSRHMCWGDEQGWSEEYNYRASMSATIHKKLRILCGISGADRPAPERTEEERERIQRLEHRRWVAYMRSEGYSYAPRRNDLAKQHPGLVPYDELSEMEKHQDFE